MSKIDSRKLIAYLETKWGSRPCPMCGKGPWNVQDSAFQLLEFHEGGIGIGGPVIPVIPVICSNCGHTLLVNAILSGVVQPAAPEKKKEEQKEQPK